MNRIVTLLGVGAILLPGIASAEVVQWASALGGNDHYYNIVRDNSLDWYGAKSAAEASSHLGMQGHLATITSQGELDFLSAPSFLGPSVSLYGDLIWLGGYQTEDTTYTFPNGTSRDVNSGELDAFNNYQTGTGTLEEYFAAAESQWNWITGEGWSSFDLWDTYNANNGASTGLVGPQVFEDFLSMRRDWWNFSVNDVKADATAPGTALRAYIVEYEPTSSSVPEPTAIVLWSSLGAIASGVTRFRRRIAV